MRSLRFALAGAAALEGASTGARPVALMGDGGFWHNGLTSGIGNAVFNRHDGLTIIVDNGYSAATGGQYVLSSRADVPERKLRNPIEQAVRGHAGSGRFAGGGGRKPAGERRGEVVAS